VARRRAEEAEAERADKEDDADPRGEIETRSSGRRLGWLVFTLLGLATRNPARVTLPAGTWSKLICMAHRHRGNPGQV
jgi:hypothetical protein